MALAAADLEVDAADDFAVSVALAQAMDAHDGRAHGRDAFRARRRPASSVSSAATTSAGSSRAGLLDDRPVDRRGATPGGPGRDRLGQPNQRAPAVLGVTRGFDGRAVAQAGHGRRHVALGQPGAGGDLADRASRVLGDVGHDQAQAARDGGCVRPAHGALADLHEPAAEEVEVERIHDPHEGLPRYEYGSHPRRGAACPLSI